MMDDWSGLATDEERLRVAAELVNEGRQHQALGNEQTATGKLRDARDLLDLVLEA